ncbi:PH domain-containing protein [Mycolicibacterium brumae]|uniref:Low molecular weight protein antigen 6 PH domain-containing protein n=1 Tax=Mycolicibacterium brumae TaxID=85968 RepID=A0A2G5P5G0_9MYCO|nr:PH domain-containing protein [Mycolicibacterium brumae]MCV7192207.1 PH domain-containing protein [Mycolicibacterium brumae]PIB73572.1 hypothetical protein CQY22_016160 [Mycolicibacterium brumae]RWA21264.1 hypothetical protein MBRU_15075 [Mycolicibacterium brumae DSM 44177]UWW07032.1 PH domain-containing protein [Mycolicibacterium brumae]
MSPTEQASWGPQSAGVVVIGVAGLALLCGSVTLASDPPGRLLTGIGGVGLVVFAVLTWRARPKIAVTDDGLMLRGWFGTQQVSRDELELVRISEFRRFGRRQRMLEIETTDDRLRVYTRWDLGVDPIQVLDTLTAAGLAKPRRQRDS